MKKFTGLIAGMLVAGLLAGCSADIPPFPELPEGNSEFGTETNSEFGVRNSELNGPEIVGSDSSELEIINYQSGIIDNIGNADNTGSVGSSGAGNNDNTGSAGSSGAGNADNIGSAGSSGVGNVDNTGSSGTQDNSEFGIWNSELNESGIDDSDSSESEIINYQSDIADNTGNNDSNGSVGSSGAGSTDNTGGAGSSEAGNGDNAGSSGTQDNSELTPVPNSESTPAYSAKLTDDTSNAGYIWNYFVDQFDNPYAAAAILGNMMAESSCIPYLVEGAGTTFSRQYTLDTDAGEIPRDAFAFDLPGKNYGYGYGLCQWTQTRKANLYDYAKDSGVSVGDIGLQCDFVMRELLSDYPGLYSYLLRCTDVTAATEQFCSVFEQAAIYGGRTDYAKQYLEKFGGSE